MIEKMTYLAATSSGIEEEHAALLKWAYDIYIGYRDVIGWIESETDPLVIGRPEAFRRYGKGGSTFSGIEEEHAALRKWAYDIYIGYRDVFGWNESETDPLVIGRPEVIRKN